MKVATRVGLVGFLLTLSSISGIKAEATTSQSTIEFRLNRIAKVIREKESQQQAEASLDKDPDLFYLAGRFLNSGNGASFLNRTPSFRNYNGGWRNNGVTGWRNGGGGVFLNRTPGFRNYNSAWRNRSVTSWRNGGQGGSFINRSPNFGNGGFRNF